MVFFVLIAVVLLSVFIWSILRQFGAHPKGERLQRIEASPQYNRATGRFQNQNPRDFQAEMPVIPMLREFIFGGQMRTPTQPLPSTRPDLSEFLKTPNSPKAFRAIWLGHSCVVLNIAGKIILLDPTLTARVSPVLFFGGRFQPPPLRLEELPAVDYIVLSHDHYDHLDADSIRFFAKPERSKTRIITALGVGARLESFGIASDRIIELDWWESFEDQGFRFTATPSQHFSGRSFRDNGKTLWVGFAIRYGSLNIFFSGDSGYHTHFKEIGERLGPFNFAILESGQYNLWWHYVHMLPEEVAQAAQDLRCESFMPIHWGMYNLSIHDWFEPVARVHALAQSKRLAIRTPRLGEIFEVGNGPAPEPEKWWESHPDYISKQRRS